MPRSLLSLVALLFAAVGISQAEYIVIRVNLNAAPPPKPAPGPGVPGVPGVPPPPPMPVVPGAKPAQPAEAPKPDKNSFVVVFVEYQSFKPYVVNGQRTSYVDIHHKWGLTRFNVNNPAVQIIPVPPPEGQKTYPTVLARFDLQKKDIGLGKNKSATEYIKLAEWCLTHGLIKQCVEVMEDVAKMDQGDPTVSAAVKAFKKVQEDLAKPITKDDASINWKKTLDAKANPSEHFELLYDSGSGPTPPEVKGRLARLEQQMNGVYYWFALHGKAMPVPDRRMVCVLVDKPSDFANYKKMFDPVPEVSDGFFARRDNLAVFSSTRLDPQSLPLTRHFTELVQANWDLKGIMNPKAPLPKNKGGEELSHVMTMALIKKALEEESEIASISHNGTRLMLTGMGLLPRAVNMPEWIQFGFPAFFETPKFDPITQTGAFWPGVGAPSWTYFVQFKLWEIEKALDSPEDALRKVLTDDYFHQVQNPLETEKLMKARTMAWAFTYYLCQRKLDNLLRYCEEMNQLPRDLELDDATNLMVFARAFDLLDANGTINEAKFNNLAKDWYTTIGLVQPQMPQLVQEAMKVVREKKANAPK